MTFKPAHKQDRPEHAPGQIRTSHPAAVTDKTLEDYILRKQRQDAFDSVAKEKKMTFEEWWKKAGNDLLDDDPPITAHYIALHAWKAAQENK